jgi:hypothetical protein
MLILALIAAVSLQVDPNAGNSKFDATFDAPLGEKIMATSAAVGCTVTVTDQTAAGACSVPLTSVTVDSEPTKTEHFQQWATNKKVDAKQCAFEAKFDALKLDAPISATPVKFSGDAAFKVCGKPRTDGGKEKLEGTAVQLQSGAIRVRAKVEKFSRDKYKIGPKYTDGWLSRVQQLAPVVADEGTIEISVFAKPAAPATVLKQ